MSLHDLVERLLKGKPLKWKLTAICVSVSLLVVTLTATAFCVVAASEYKRLTVQDIGTVVDIIADNSGAPLVFLDQETATDVINTLQAETRVRRAVIVDAEGAYFTGYSRSGESSEATFRDLVGLELGQHGSYSRIVQGTGIWVDGELVGQVTVEADLSDLWAQLLINCFFAASLVLLSAILAYIVARRLQETISEPIVQLIELAKSDLEQDHIPPVNERCADELVLLNELLRLLHIQRQNLAKAKIAAEDSDRAKSQFLANVSHEMRTPLNAVIGYADLIREDCVEHCLTQNLDTADRILSSGKHLLKVINRILDLSRMEMGEECVHPESEELVPLVKGVYENQLPAAEEKEVRLTWSVDTEAPPKLVLDGKKLRALLGHLVENAVKFTPERGSVDISVVKEGNTLLFSVEDTGVGISKELQEIVFEPFRQTEDWRTRQADGTGLGLAICKKLVEQMQGDIWVKSVEDKGSTFIFRLPIVLPIDGIEPEMDSKASAVL